MVAFSQAIYDYEHTVEDIQAVRSEPNDIEQHLREGKIPVLIDPENKIAENRKFDIVIDGRMAKTNLGTTKNEAPIVIGFGPGFEAGVDCHAVIETLAGHNLGRAIYSGKPAMDTGVPIPTDYQQTPCCAGFIPEPCCASSIIDVNNYLIRAPSEGVFSADKKIGDQVTVGDIIGRIDDVSVQAKVNGIIRGLINDGVKVTRNLKIGDIDPSGDRTRVFQISEKANAIAGGVLEACLFLLNKNSNI
jgi:xanthine dehydrogenase accessory factor